MPDLFDIVPANFFNYLGSGSNKRIYAQCLLIIYTIGKRLNFLLSLFFHK